MEAIWKKLGSMTSKDMEEVKGDEGRLEAGVDDLVGLQGGYQHVEDPEEDEDTGGDCLVDLKEEFAR
jgi:hypothetical protein